MHIQLLAQCETTTQQHKTPKELCEEPPENKQKDRATKSKQKDTATKSKQKELATKSKPSKNKQKEQATERKVVLKENKAVAKTSKYSDVMARFNEKTMAELQVLFPKVKGKKLTSATRKAWLESSERTQAISEMSEAERKNEEFPPSAALWLLCHVHSCNISSIKIVRKCASDRFPMLQRWI